MNWKLFIAGRIYRSDEDGKEVSKPAVRIAMCGIAVGLAVMIISVAVVIGFKHQVKEKVVGLGADVLVTSLAEAQSYQSAPMAAADSLLGALGNADGVIHAQRYSVKPGMIMADDNFLGMVLKGVGQEYDLSFLRAHLLEGEIPAFSDSVSSNKVLLSRTVADKLHLKLGDKLYTYYLEDNIRARRLTVAGIYQTNFSMFDDLFLISDLHTVNRLNAWNGSQASGIELKTAEGADAELVTDGVRELLGCDDEADSDSYYARSVSEVYPQIFAWLDLLDVNVWVILILMTGVAGITMISGLLIIILERTNMIGVLKALGADNASIRKIFLSFSVLLIGKGMLWGNVVALVFYFAQRYFHLVRLDPVTYYVDSVPVELHVGVWLLLNVATLLVSVAMLVGPSCLISKINPARSIRFE